MLELTGRKRFFAHKTMLKMFLERETSSYAKGIVFTVSQTAWSSNEADAVCNKADAVCNW